MEYLVENTEITTIYSNYEFINRINGWQYKFTGILVLTQIIFTCIKWIPIKHIFHVIISQLLSSNLYNDYCMINEHETHS